eukprot:jgi/Ulvmu1/3691/UM017_0108.1
MRHKTVVTRTPRGGMADEEGDAGQEGPWGAADAAQDGGEPPTDGEVAAEETEAGEEGNGGAADAAQDGGEPTADGEVADEGTDAGEEGPGGGRCGTRSWIVTARRRGAR